MKKVISFFVGIIAIIVLAHYTITETIFMGKQNNE